MTRRQPLGYAIVRHWLRGPLLMAVTTERAGRVYGAFLDRQGMGTNAAERDVLARFPTEPLARAALARVRDVTATTDKVVAIARANLEEAQRMQRLAIERAARGEAAP